MFQELFRKKSDCWEILHETDFCVTDAGEFLIPDFTFVHKESGKRLALELFHRWHRAPLDARIQWLSEHPDTPLILGIDRALADDHDLETICTRSPQIAGHLFLFRDFPGVDRVEKMLNGQ